MCSSQGLNAPTGSGMYPFKPHDLKCHVDRGCLYFVTLSSLNFACNRSVSVRVWVPQQAQQCVVQLILWPKHAEHGKHWEGACGKLEY